MIRIALFASGDGSNAYNIARYFQGNPKANVVLCVTNNPEAGVIGKMNALGIPVELTENPPTPGKLFRLLKDKNIDLIVLAGYLKLIPHEIVENWNRRILNIHPALLPKFGGKGMYGMRVHEAVVKAGEKTTGITIHYVNEHFDEGEIIARYETPISTNDTPLMIREKVHALEMRWYPVEIEKLIW